MAEAGFDESYARAAILKKTVDKIKDVDSSVRSFYLNTDVFKAAGIVAFNNAASNEKAELSSFAQPALMEV